MTAHSPAFLRRLALLLAGLSMFGPFAIDAIFPAFPALQLEFDAPHSAVQQSVSVYLLAYALMSVFHGPFSDALGRRPVILAGIVLFMVASVGAALSQSLSMLLLCRALQGVSAGAGLIVGRAVIRDCVDGDAAQRLMAQATMIFSVAPAIAPIVGGWILGWSDWHSIFWAMAIFAGLVFVACCVWLPETHPKEVRTSLRLKPLAKSSWAILSNRRFLLLAFAACLNFGALFLYIASAPIVVLDHLGLNEQQFGWLFIPLVIGLMSGSFLSGRLAGRLSQSSTAKLGFFLTLAASVGNLIYNLAVDQLQLPWGVLSMAFSACGIGLVFPLLTIAMLDMYPKHRGTASSMQAFVGLGFNALLAGVISPWVAPHREWLAASCVAMCLMAIVLWWRYRVGVKRDPTGIGMPQAIDEAEHL